MKKFLFTLPVLFILNGCLGTMISGTDRIVNIQTPNGEQVRMEVSGKYTKQEITAPASVNVAASKEPLAVKVIDPNYKQTTKMVSSKINVVSLFDFLFGTFGTTGATVDTSNGSFWTYSSDVVVPVISK